MSVIGTKPGLCFLRPSVYRQRNNVRRRASVHLLRHQTAARVIELSGLEQSVGMRGTALEWSESYLSDMRFSVQLGQFSSTKAPLGHGVPQGSILGPILFSLYLLPLCTIFDQCNVAYRCYADDIQLYLPLESGGPSV